MAGLTIGEVAARCGVSVRALRLYEAQGLLRPARSLAGRRWYGAEDLARMHNILVLKRAGWKLAEIARLLRGGALEPGRLIDMQIELVERRHAELGRALGSLKAARATLAGEENLSVDVLCDLIRTGEETMTSAAWNNVFERYYSAEELEKWREVKNAFEPDSRGSYAGDWKSLIARVESAVASGMLPQSPDAVALAQAWITLQRPMVDAVGTETWGKAAQMYEEMDQWQTETVRSPFSLEVYRFVCAAAEAGRAQGVILPRAA